MATIARWSKADAGQIRVWCDCGKSVQYHGAMPPKWWENHSCSERS